ncbi:head decoration protein [Rhodopseudomonas palustris]
MATEVKYEGQHRGEFLVSEGPGTISREDGILTAGQSVKDGQAIALSNGKLVAATGARDGSGVSTEDIKGFALGDYTAPAGGSGVPIVYIARLAEVKEVSVTYSTATGGTKAAADAAVKAALAKAFIIAR